MMIGQSIEITNSVHDLRVTLSDIIKFPKFELGKNGISFQVLDPISPRRWRNVSNLEPKGSQIFVKEVTGNVS